MITADVQIHGYRKGHQLIASSAILSKDDQAVIDRLSDVAGPLRPREQFTPYLSAYPLPSGKYYVIARTWQDHSVARAGCVRTMSILIDAEAWAIKPPLLPILRLLGSSELPNERDAARITLEGSYEEPLPPVRSFSASELLEALFLEDAKPVVVFDAPDPELIALRLLTALWPDIRRRFALSTFALSPRKIGGRDLDLVFAPMNARSKFGDWLGRRVDGRSVQNNRHKWTGEIVHRVFMEPLPRLLSDEEIALLNARDADSASALRIALLWDELLDKLHQSPTAALGLLDIANSGMVKSSAAVRLLDPLLAEATHRAVSTLSVNDAWDFVGAIVRKIRGQGMPSGSAAVRQLAEQLAERSPEGAIDLLTQSDAKGAIVDLVPNIAKGLGRGAEERVEHALLKAPTTIIATLVAQGGDLANRVANDEKLIHRIGQALTDVSNELAERTGSALLPFLINDWQAAAAEPVFSRLSPEAVAEKLRWLGEANGFQTRQLCLMLLKRAHKIDALPAIRDVLITSCASKQRDSLLTQTIAPTAFDVSWLLNEKRLTKTALSKLLVSVLEQADEEQLAELLSDNQIGERILECLPRNSVNVWTRIALQEILPLNTQVKVARALIPKLNDSQKIQIVRRTLTRCLRRRFEGDETNFLLMLFEILGAQLDGIWVVNAGLGRAVDADVACRNLIAFDRAPVAARERIVAAVDEIAVALRERHKIDLDEAASEACARLMFDAEKAACNTLLSAAGRLMPSLLDARCQPVSLIVAALFPLLYHELAKADDGPDFLKFLPFVDWDRCKTARRELVEAFMSSPCWKPGDLALTAYRCDDTTKILKRVAKIAGGDKYLEHIENDLERLNDDIQGTVKYFISNIRSDRGFLSKVEK